MSEPAPPPQHSSRALVAATLAAFATFGAFWGAWGASIPRIRDQAGVTEAELGIALLCVGAGALPAMLLTGRVVDRAGLWVAGPLVLALGAFGALTSLTSHGFVSLFLGLLLVGAASGAADVAMNAVAGRTEQQVGRPVITRAHGVLSGFVVLASLAAGGAAALRLPVSVPFLAVGAMALVACVAMLRVLPRATAPEHPAAPERGAARGLEGGAAVPVALVGVLGALGFASENAHQNWSALYARDVLGASVANAALAPAFFAAVVSAARLAIGGLGARHALAVLVGGGAAAAAGALVVSVADTAALFALGLALAAAGTAVLFPTVLGIVARTTAEARRGRATSLVTTVSYLGFLLGPAYVGLWAGALGLRAAMVAVAGLAVALVVLAPFLLRLAGHARAAD